MTSPIFDLIMRGGSAAPASPAPQQAPANDGLFEALLMQESGGQQLRPDGTPVTSSKGAIGIAQVMPGTAPEAAALAGLPWDEARYRSDADYNRALGRAYFEKQLADFGETPKALAAYNAGPGALRKAMARAESAGNPDAWLDFLPAETRDYVPKILGRAGGAGAAPSSAAAPTPAPTRFAPGNEGLVAAGPARGGAKVGDFGREFAASLLSGVGSIGQAFGEIGAAAANKITGTEDFEGKNLLGGAAQGLRDGMSEGGKQAARDAQITGSIDDLSSIELPKSGEGWAMLTAGVLGSLASTVVPMIGPMARVASAAKAGDAARLASATRAATAAGAGLGAAQTGGAAAEEVRQTATEAVGQMSHEQLLAQVPAYRDAFDRTGNEDQARAAAVNSAAQLAGMGAAVFGAVGGVINAKILEDIILKQGVTKALGTSMATRLGVGVPAAGAIEGGQEVTERVGQNLGEDAALGREADPLRNTAGDFIGGLVGGGAVGGVAAMRRPELAPVEAKAAEPNSPLSKSAVAGVVATDAQNAAAPPQAPVDPAQRLAELEAVGKSGGVFTPEQRQEYEALKGARDATPGAKPDAIGPRVESVRAAITPAVLDALRAEGSDYTAKDLLKDLAIARSASAQESQREQALARIETGLEWAGANPAPVVETNIDEITGSSQGDLREPSARPAAGQLRAGVDRDAELIAQRDGTPARQPGQRMLDEAARREEAAALIEEQPGASPDVVARAAQLREQAASLRKAAAQQPAQPATAGAATARDRELIDVQRQTNLEMRLGAENRPQPISGQNRPEPIAAGEQERLETAALTGKEAARKREDDPRQVVVDRALRNVEERGGVASPAEARIFQEAGIGKPYDRIDESLGDTLSTDERLTQATGIALERRPRETVRQGQQSEAALVAQEQRDRSDSRMQALAAERAARQQPAAQPPAAPLAADSVIQALKTIPSLRTAEQKAVVDAARRGYTAEQMRIMNDAAVNPANLSATDKVRLREMRDGDARRSTPRGPARAQLYTMRRQSDARIAAADRERASDPRSEEDLAIERRRAEGDKWARDTARPGAETNIAGVVLRETSRRMAPVGRFISYRSADGEFEFDHDIEDGVISASRYSEFAEDDDFIGDFESMEDAVRAAYGDGDARRSTVRAPSTPPGAAGGSEPAVIRKRRRQLDKLADAGFETVERRDGVFFIRNSRTGEERQLSGRADAALARAAVAAAKSRPTKSADLLGKPIDDDLVSFGPRAGTLGVPRAQMPQVKAEHRGALANFLMARGVTLKHEEVDPRTLRATQAEVSRERIQRAKGFTGGQRSILIAEDGRVLDGHHQWLAALDGGAPVKVIRLGAPIERLLELAREFPSSTVEADAAPATNDAPAATTDTPLATGPAMAVEPDRAPGTTFDVPMGGRRVMFKRADVSQLSEQESPERDGRARRISKKAAALITEIAAALGKRVQFFEDVNGERPGDGFVIPSDPDTIYLNTVSTINPLAVFGHEFQHTLRLTNPEAWNAIAAVVRERVKDAKGFRRDYYGAEEAEARGSRALSEEQGGELEELVSDLGGNLMTDASFWRDVFAKIDADNGKEAKGIIARLIAQLQALFDMAIAAAKGPRFKADRFVDDAASIRAAYRDALAQYLKGKGQSQAGMQAEILKSAQGMAVASSIRLSSAEDAAARSGGIRAYHASPFKFDKFLTSKIGGGEGAQAYGFGLYFTDSKSVLDFYRATVPVAAKKRALGRLNKPGNLLNDGRQESRQIFVGSRSFDIPSNPMRDYLLTGPELSEAIAARHLRNVIDGLFAGRLFLEERSGAIARVAITLAKARARRASLGPLTDGVVSALESWRDEGIAIASANMTPTVYTVDLRLDASRTALWDAPISNQPDVVKEAVKPLRSALHGGKPVGDETFGEFYKRTINGFEDAPGRSLSIKLSEAGVQAISYRAGDRTGTNYVVLSDDLVSIVEAASDGAGALRSPERGIHFSKQQRATINGAYYGTGLKGLEAERLRASDDQRLKTRVYFYVDEGQGVRPEAGVGGVAHEVELPKLYDAKANAEKLWNSGDINGTESRILDAGYHGYFVKNHETGQGLAVVIGEKAQAMPAKPVQPKLGGPITANVPETLKAAPSSKELDLINVAAIPGATLRAGMLRVPETSRDMANAEMERIGSPIRFSKERLNTPAEEIAAVRAQHEGKETWLKAPNGRPSNLTERQWLHVRTPSFRAWFGDWLDFADRGVTVWNDDKKKVSKVVDENGEPMVVYHGTDKGGFAIFKQPGGKKRGDLGIFTTDDLSMARTYVRRGRGRMLSEGEINEDPNEGGNEAGVYALFMNVRDPQESDFAGANWDGQRMRQFVVENDDGEQLYTDTGEEFFESEEDAMELVMQKGGTIQPAPDHYEDTDGVVREARSMRNDGAIIRRVRDDGGGYSSYSGEPADLFVALDPGQVKSADFNSGEYSVSTDDIRFSRERAAGIKPEIIQVAGPVLKYLTPAERLKLRRDTAQTLVDTFKKLPSGSEMAAVAYAGRAKRGWYYNSAMALEHVFGHDAPRFAALLAAMSPQTSVEMNLRNALNTWKNWVNDGRPSGRDAIFQIMGRSVEGSKLTDSVLPAWVNNSVRALSAEDASAVVLSGPKVNSFMLNLRGFVDEVTNDAWMANYALVDQHIFSGGLNADGTDPGKGPGYLAMSAKAREAARKLTALTGDEWTPAEVQETVWSWAKTLFELQSKDVGARELLYDGAVTDELIASTPDFRTQLHEGRNEQTLTAAGYGEQLSTLRRREDLGSKSGEGSGAGEQAGPFDRETQSRYEQRAASRLEKLRDQRFAAEAANRDAVRSSARDGEGGAESRGPAPLEGAPNVRGAAGPDPRLVEVARLYAANNGIPLRRQAEYVKVDPERAARIAAAYEAMPHSPTDKRVRAAYEDLIRQTRAQYDALIEAGYEFWFMDPAADPYAGNPWNAMRDLRASQRMAVFPTEAGFGSSELDVADNPLLADTGLRWGYGKPDGEQKRVLANDLFRAVHDAFGHGLEGAGFRADGEENAWQAHVRLFTGPAVGAITSETRGQNSWLNYGPYGEKNRNAKLEDTVFADQKTGLMPEWTWSEGVAEDAAETPLPPAAAPAALEKIFEGMRGTPKERKSAKAAAEAHPLSAKIQEVEENFFDILEELETAQRIEINCD